MSKKSEPIARSQEFYDTLSEIKSCFKNFTIHECLFYDGGSKPESTLARKELEKMKKGIFELKKVITADKKGEGTLATRIPVEYMPLKKKTRTMSANK